MLRWVLIRFSPSDWDSGLNKTTPIRARSATSSTDDWSASSELAATMAAVTPSGAALRTRVSNPSPRRRGSAKRAHIVMVFRPRGADDARACRARELDRHRPDTASGCMHNHHVRSPDADSGNSGRRGLTRRGEHTRFRPGHGYRLAYDRVGENPYQLGVGTEHGPAENLIAHPYRRDAFSDGVHNASKFVAEPLRKVSWHPLANGAATEQTIKRLDFPLP